MPTSTDTLTHLLARKCELLVQLRELGVRQAELIAAGDLGQLLKLLAAKQRLLIDVQGVERALDPFRNQSPEERHWLSVDDRRRCAELAAACERLLAEIVAGEKQSEQHLQFRRDEAAAQLNAVHFAATARGEYVRSMVPQLSSFDSELA